MFIFIWGLFKIRTYVWMEIWWTLLNLKNNTNRKNRIPVSVSILCTLAKKMRRVNSNDFSDFNENTNNAFSDQNSLQSKRRRKKQFHFCFLQHIWVRKMYNFDPFRVRISHPTTPPDEWINNLTRRPPRTNQKKSSSQKRNRRKNT